MPRRLENDKWLFRVTLGLCLLGAVMIETSRGRGGSPSSFEVGLQYLITGLKSAPP